MQETVSRKAPGWFWAAAVFAVAWEAFGCYIYLSQTLTEPAAREGGYATMATWQWGVFATAVWSGLIGALLLLARSRWASTLLLLSLFAAAVQYGYAAYAGMLTSADRPMAAIILGVGLLLVVFAGYGRRKGWLR